MFVWGPYRERGCKFVCYKPLKISVAWAFPVVQDLSRQLYFYHNIFYFSGYFPYFLFYNLDCFSNPFFPPLYNLVYHSISYSVITLLVSLGYVKLVSSIRLELLIKSSSTFLIPYISSLQHFSRHSTLEGFLCWDGNDVERRKSMQYRDKAVSKISKVESMGDRLPSLLSPHLPSFSCWCTCMYMLVYSVECEIPIWFLLVLPSPVLPYVRNGSHYHFEWHQGCF